MLVGDVVGWWMFSVVEHNVERKVVAKSREKSRLKSSHSVIFLKPQNS